MVVSILPSLIYNIRGEMTSGNEKKHIYRPPPRLGEGTQDILTSLYNDSL